jgi:hypothetical protein
VRDCNDCDLEDGGVLGDAGFNFQGRDVFAARDDDVLLAVLDRNVSVWMTD